MIGYLARRLAWAGAMVLGVTLIAFLVAYALPGDPARLIAGERADAATVEAVRANLGLNDPLPLRYVRFLGGVATGDLGRSNVTRVPVISEIAQRVPATALLALSSLTLCLVGGIVLGVVAAGPTRPGASGTSRRFREGTLFVLSIAGASVPTFWLGLLLLSLLAGQLRLLPAGGYGSAEHLVLPVLTLSAGGVAYYARLVHAGMRDALEQDYVRTARAKGMPEHIVVRRHALRNALLPIVTIAGADLAALLGGVLFTESVFSWPGVGRLAYDAMAARDMPVILGVVLVSAAVVIFANLLVDLTYPLLDPRIRLRSSQTSSG